MKHPVRRRQAETGGSRADFAVDGNDDATGWHAGFSATGGAIGRIKRRQS